MSKIVLPKEVAEALAFFVNLADTKTEALTDILSMGYEGSRSEIILRHFNGNHDELMEALICGYQVEQTPEDNVAEMFITLYNSDYVDEHSAGVMDGIIDTLNTLGIKIEGVNA